MTLFQVSHLQRQDTPCEDEVATEVWKTVRNVSYPLYVQYNLWLSFYSKTWSRHSSVIVYLNCIQKEASLNLSLYWLSWLSHLSLIFQSFQANTGILSSSKNGHDPFIMFLFHFTHCFGDCLTTLANVKLFICLSTTPL